MCKIIPPSSFKPECNVDDDMRFTAYNQYVHKLMNRWGPNSKEMAAIKKYLDTQNVTINASNHPCVSGVEIDLPALYHAVQSLGGLTEVISRNELNFLFSRQNLSFINIVYRLQISKKILIIAQNYKILSF